METSTKDKAMKTIFKFSIVSLCKRCDRLMSGKKNNYVGETEFECKKCSVHIVTKVEHLRLEKG